MRARIPIQGQQKKAMDMEIRRQLAEYDEKNTLEIDAMVLWVLYSQFGFGKRRLRKFFDLFNVELDALINRYVMDNSDVEWLCTRKLKDAGIDILQWSNEKSKED